MRNPIPWLVVTWGLICLAVVGGGLAVTLSPGEMTWAWPVPGGFAGAVGLTRPTALVLAILAVLALAGTVNLAKPAGRARPWAELVLYYPLVFGGVWWVMGPGRPGLSHILLGGLLLAAAGILKRTLPLSRPTAPSWRTWRAGDALVILLPVAVGLALDQAPDGPAIWISLLLYPLYAAVQLFVFLVIPADRLRVLGASGRLSTVACAALFALVHWPNPLLMLLTGVAMALWAPQYRRGRPFWQLALVMGLAATTVAQFLPDDLTRHLRVGPGYIRQETVLAAAGDPAVKGRVPLDDYLARMYPQTVGRAPHPGEYEAWAVTLDQALRPVTAWRFFISAEYGRLAVQLDLPPAPSPEQPWTDLDPLWQKRLHGLAEQGAALPWPDYIDFLYEAVLGRSPSAEEGHAWTRDLNWSQRKRITEVLLDWRWREGEESPVRVTPAELNLLQ